LKRRALVRAARHVAFRAALPLALVVACVAAIVWPSDARALDRNFVGSAQVDYSFVPLHHDAKAFPNSFDGFTMELAGKLAVDFNDHLSANLKVCFGCHGFEADMMYFDYRVADELNIRAGRFSPSFGAFNLRHDPANHRTSDKPLPYDMGRMLHMRQWNMGVLPAPFPDNGVEVNGTHAFGRAQMDYAVYAVSGFKAAAGATDIDFALSRSPAQYYVDNNARPTGGGRLSLTLKLGESSDMVLGGSAMYGNYDPDNKLAYLIFGGDLTFRFDRTNVRLEYLARRTEFDTTNQAAYKYTIDPSHGDFFMKHGAYVEIEHPVTRDLDLVLRGDGMLRLGNVTADSQLSFRSTVVRGTLGFAYVVIGGLRVKGSTEIWKFSDADETNRSLELGFHAALVGTF
jgi:hypothetical protein